MVGSLGAGWLGCFLAKKGIQNKLKLKLSTTSPKKISDLRNICRDSYIINVQNDIIEGDLNFFKGINDLIISIPPGLRKNPKKNYVKIIEKIVEKIVLFGIKKVIFLSSISVYGFQNNLITENSKTFPASISAKQILECEKKLIENSAFECCVLRLGGLVGTKRHPIYKLSGLKNLPNPKSPINLIHQEDVVDLILNIIDNWHGNDIFNLVNTFHPSREEYYTRIAKIANLSPPKFKESGDVFGEISSSKILKLTNFNFTVENLLILK